MAKSVEDYIIDFSKEESGGGGGIRVKAGTYRVKIVAAKPVKSAEKGTLGLELTLAFMDGKYRQAKKKIKDTLWVSPKAYSRFRTLLEACDEDVPGKIKLTSIAKAVKGSELYVEIDDETREGYSTRSRVTFDGFINPEDYDPDDAEDDDDEDEEDEDLDDEDEDEEEEEDDEDEDEDDEEDEEPEPPKKKRRAKAKPAAKRKKSSKRKATDDDDDEELDELDLDEL